MFGLFEAFAKRVDEQTRDYLEAQKNIRQRALSGLLDPFQILQPMQAAVESSRATELQPPKLPAERRARRKPRGTVKAATRKPKRPKLNFA